MKWSFVFIGILLFAIEYYSYVAVSMATKSMQPKFKISIIVIHILISILGWGGLILMRTMGPQFPQNIKAIAIALIMGIFVAKIIIMVLLFLGDGYRFIQWIVSLFKTVPQESIAADDPHRISRSVFLSRASLLIGGLIMGGFVWGTTNRYRYHIKKIKLSIAGLPDALKGFKIAQISDVHSGSFDNKAAVAHGVDLILEQQPDLVLFTGDLVNDRASELEPYLDVFSKLTAPLGVYSTLGNHDYGDYVTWNSDAEKKANLDQLKAYHKQMGWNLMMNEHVVLEKGGAAFALLGVENWSAKDRFPKHGLLKKAYEGLEARQTAFKVLMSHDPSHWDAQVKQMYPDINLTLSGHTHGMQFGIELPWMKWSPVQYMYKQWAGLYTDQDQHLYVNRGFGFLGYQGRLGILPEITIIEFA
ncbi:metallophosphoesterase [Taibaiella sp. KBW10]|uniref:metallophosphoesterase n=1 Tax=Taibaiella sp. KBW10 TaxID=2153357 RepID=UPI001F2D0D31|nr:metallophosphoesterase [Taibaiella sp. KBW10]